MLLLYYVIVLYSTMVRIKCHGGADPYSANVNTVPFMETVSRSNIVLSNVGVLNMGRPLFFSFFCNS